VAIAMVVVVIDDARDRPRDVGPDVDRPREREWECECEEWFDRLLVDRVTDWKLWDSCKEKLMETP